ncbi:LapA family protein [Gilvimarinus sp. F26214L]|uniref:LapA family protein n=1 Tax=Gilvimarinus sp. DZF01 TaxID=3461371 RepID=UPI0040467BDC
MTKIKVIASAIIAVVVMGLGWWISSENNQLVSPTLMGISLPSLNLGAWLFIVLLLGGVAGYLLSLLSYIRIRSKSLSLQRKLNRCEQEVAKLRTAALRD